MTNFTKLEPVPLPLNISSTIEHRTYRQRNSAEGKIFLSYREDIAVLNHFYRTLLKIAKSNYKKTLRKQLGSLLFAISSSTHLIQKGKKKWSTGPFALLLFLEPKKKWSTGPFFYLAIG
ncbi:TPA: hypothetical protein TXU88_002292 [Streptococcus suis]|nr:hypothetical protein [Streptococcus suis]HEM2651932.1 hypothetical protein [Streptococcus suis]HEM5103876.1 hypothetical protein [Streptococcus suis]